MTLFDDRERAFELKFVHELETRFRTSVLRTRRAAEWAAAQMGMTPEEAAGYVHDQITALLNRLDETAIGERLRSDLDARGVAVDDAVFKATMARISAESFEAAGALPVDRPAGRSRVARPH